MNMKHTHMMSICFCLVLMGQQECQSPEDVDNDGWTVSQGDCNDNDTTIYPGATELCDLKDNDCNDIIDDNEDCAVKLVQFFGPSDNEQCNQAASGEVEATLGSWMAKVALDTDSRIGGCEQKFAIIDPSGILRGLDLTINFYASGDSGQCQDTVIRTVPISSSMEEIEWSVPYIIDTDERSGWCEQTFAIAGRDDVYLDINYTADGDEGQCGNIGQHTVSSTESTTLVLDMDDRSGWCGQQFRLRHN